MEYEQYTGTRDEQRFTSRPFYSTSDVEHIDLAEIDECIERTPDFRGFVSILVRRWLSENYRLAERNLLAYIDLGNGILANSTLNLHGSPLFEQIARRAADAVSSPLVHNHTCHQRVKPTAGDSHGEHQHDHGRRRRHDGEHEHHESSDDEPKETSCVPHRLLDEWIRASHQQISANNDANIVQLIDVDSSAALFQLQQGVPSMLIEMTDQQVSRFFFLSASQSVSQL